MAGIDNITNAILQEAKEKAASVISAAERKAAESKAAAEQEGKELSGKIAEKAARDAIIYGERIESQAGMLKKQAALTAKQEIINGVIDAACEKLRKQGDADYFSMITALVGKHLRAEKGEILFSAKDLGRLPSGFADALSKLASAAGGALVISKEAAEIDDGFILRYGGIEENCTLKALFSEKHEALVDKVTETIW